jgi:hypothetical protein
MAWLQLGNTTLLFSSMQIPHSSSISILLSCASCLLLYPSEHLALLCFVSINILLFSASCLHLYPSEKTAFCLCHQRRWLHPATAPTKYHRCKQCVSLSQVQTPDNPKRNNPSFSSAMYKWYWFLPYNSLMPALPFVSVHDVSSIRINLHTELTKA